MKNGTCIKCGAEDVYRDKAVGHRAMLPHAPFLGFSQPTIYIYLCCTCGYFEEYVSEKKTTFLDRFRGEGTKVAVSGS